MRVTHEFPEERVLTSAIWSCQLCGETIDSMGGPGDGEICVKCGDDIMNGRIKHKREE